MTVDELLDELGRFPPSDEVVVSDSPTSAFKLLGVFGRDGKVYLDPSTAEQDKVKGFLSED